MIVKCITLSQPWATLVVRGLKIIETRGRDTKYRGELFIHAGKSKEYGKGENKISIRELCYQEPFKTFISPDEYDNLPFGAIIGKVNLIDSFTSEEAKRRIKYLDHFKKLTESQELAFGDYSPGRYGYLLSDPDEFIMPYPAKGNQIIPWQIDLPNEWSFDISNNPEAMAKAMQKMR